VIYSILKNTIPIVNVRTRKVILIRNSRFGFGSGSETALEPYQKSSKN
jgi:hypothetical protein